MAKRYSQPQLGPVFVDKDTYPECVYAGTVAGGFNNLVGPEKATIAGATKTVTRNGEALALSASGYINTGYSKNTPNSERTYLLVGNLPSNANGYGRLWTRNDSQELLLWDGSSLSLAYGTMAPVWSFAAQALRLVLSVKNGQTLVFNNGILVHENNYSATYTGNSYPLYIANRAAADRAMYGPINAFALFDKAYDRETCRALSENPWQLFSPSSARADLFVPSAGGGPTDTPVTPAVGTLALVGYAPTVSRTNSRSITADVGTLALTGYAPTVTVGASSSLVPATGTVSLVGYSPTVSRTANLALISGVGTLAFTGYAPTVDRTSGATAAPQVGTLSFVGYAPTVSFIANLALVPDVGTISLVGYAPTVNRTSGATLIPASGTLTVVGYAPSVTATANTALITDVGTLTLAGYAPTVTQAVGSQSILVGVGAMTLTGYAPTVKQAAPASFDLDALALAIIKNPKFLAMLEIMIN